MSNSEEGWEQGFYLGLTDLAIHTPSVELGGGVTLQSAQTEFIMPLTLVNTDSASMKQQAGPLDKNGYPPLPRPAYWQIGGQRTSISAELHVTEDAAPTHVQRTVVARIILFLLRLWCRPSVGMYAIADHSFSKLIYLDGDQQFTVQTLGTYPRHFVPHSDHPIDVVQGIAVVRDRWKVAHRLYNESAEFRLGIDALESCQSIANEALILLSFWGALEALFSPSTSELRFRIAALIASYLEPIGEQRMNLQREVFSMYDKRSAAAHGRPKHQTADVLAAYALLRRVLWRMICDGAVPTKDHLERLLFGVSTSEKPKKIN